MIKEFDLEKFSQFTTSTRIDGNFVGLYEGKVVRIVEKNKNDFSYLVKKIKSIPYIVGSQIVFSDDQRLIIEHSKLDYITYYNEWTKKQRVVAARAVIEIQIKLDEIGYFLADPHAFNITFRYASPVYFDLGSIKKGKIKSYWWFLKCFTGWRENDYWDDVLNIGTLSKLVIALMMYFSNNPYEYLKARISRYEKTKSEKILHHFISSNNMVRKVFQFMSRNSPIKFKAITNWTGYGQKNPLSEIDNIRVLNILEIIKKYKPSTIIDIGANKGAYSILALNNGVERSICIDLDQFSLTYLFNETKKKGWRIYSVLLNIMDYDQSPGKYNSYLPAHERLFCNFGICLAVVHHVCYFNDTSFDEFASKINLFVKNKLIIEFVPYNDKHLNGPVYKGKDRSWYTQENFINAFQKYYPGNFEILESFPKPRILIKFSK